LFTYLSFISSWGVFGLFAIHRKIYKGLLRNINTMENKERIKSIKMSGEKCKLSGSTSIFDCHCNDCYNNIVEYLGKKKGKKYFYNGKFTPEYMRNRHVVIEKFCANEDDKTSSCECFIKLFGGEGGQVQWIPREEIISNLLEVEE